nr:hypothetical protein [Tanacetum cinerariifolium]
MTTEDEVTEVFAIVCVIICGLVLITAIFARFLNEDEATVNRVFERRRSQTRTEPLVVRVLRLWVNLEEVDDGALDNVVLIEKVKELHDCVICFDEFKENEII